MNEFFEVLSAAGPFTTPLCFGMAFAINWLLKRMATQEQSLATLQGEVRGLIERLAGVSAKNATDYQAHVQATYAAIERLARAVER